MRWLVLLLAVALASCATTGPISAPVAAGAASMLVVFDQLLAAGVLDSVQHAALVQGLEAIDKSVKAVEAAQKGSLSVEEASGAAAAIVASVLAAIRLRHKGLVGKLLSGQPSSSSRAS